jgi:ribonuclease HII
MLSIRHTYDSKIEAGIDEAGRGSFWGPLMAGAVIWPDETNWTDEHRAISAQIRDSKKISAKKRIVIAEQIKRLSSSWGVGTVLASELDEKGVSWANQEAFRRAIAKLTIQPDRILIDGILALSGWIGEQHTIVDGDATFLSIAAASILAKVEHDSWIQEFCSAHPDIGERYSLNSSKGYGTAKHRDALRAYGAHEFHRRTYVYNYVSSITVQGSQASPTTTSTTTTSISTTSTPSIFSKKKCLIQLPP